MPTSILDIEIRDEAFTKLKSSFDAYNAQVEKQPEAWVKIGNQAKEIATAILIANQAMEKSNDNIEKTAKGFKEVNRLSLAGKRAFSDLVEDSKKLADNVMSISKQMLGWAGIGGIFSGLLGAGGLFGLDRYAHQIAAGTKGAQGLGITLGEQRSFRLNYERYVEPDSLLSKVADAQTDYTKMQWFRSLGIQGDVSKMNPQELAMQVYRRSRDLYASSDKSQQFVHSRGIDNFLTMEELRRSTKFSDRDIEASERQTRQDNKTFALDPGTENSWRRLNTALDKAEMKINTVLINGLAPLADPLAKLSDRFSDLIASLLKSPVIKEWMVKLGDGLEYLDKWVGSAAFKSDVESFVTNISKLAIAAGDAVKWILEKLGITSPAPVVPKLPPDRMEYYRLHPDEAPVTPEQERRKRLGYAWFGADRNGRVEGEPGYQPPEKPFDPRNPGKYNDSSFDTKAVKVATQLEKDFNLTPEQASGIVGNLGQESGLRAINEKNPLVPGSKGGFGWAQWTGVRRDNFFSWAKEHNLSPESDEANYGFLAYEMQLPENQQILKALREAKTPAEAARAWFRFESGGDPRAIYGNRDGISEKVNRLLKGEPPKSQVADRTYNDTLRRLREQNQSPKVGIDGLTSASPPNTNLASIERRGTNEATYRIVVANNTGGNAIITAGALAS